MFSARDELLEEMSLISDEPDEQGLCFDFPKYAEQVSALLKSAKTPTPFTIAIHGEWGSGKTTLLNMIEQRISDVDMQVVRFNAWEYERSGVVASLLKHIAKSLKDEHLAKHAVSFALDAFLRKIVGMTKSEVESHFVSSYEATSSVREKLECLLSDQKLLIFIDDLDRCSADGILSVLESVKMFFNIKNVIVVMAIDMTKVERAWELRYNSIGGKIEGREHAEKMFSLKLALPPKSTKDMRSYLKRHAKSLSEAQADVLLNYTQFNPRKIKRMLNLMYVILLNVEDRGNSRQEIDDNFKADLPMLVAWIALTLNHPDMARHIRREPMTLITAAVICNRMKGHGDLVDLLHKVDNTQPINGGWRIESVSVSASVITPKIRDLLRNIANEPSSFKIVSYFADQFGLTDRAKRMPLANTNQFKKFIPPLKSIIEDSGLIGV